jgi:hypothetical protein
MGTGLGAVVSTSADVAIVHEHQTPETRNSSTHSRPRFTHDKRLRAALSGGPQPVLVFGGVLLSHTVSGAVPSALEGLASGFGMLPGVSPSLWPPKLYGHDKHGQGVCLSGVAQWMRVRGRPLAGCVACLWSSPRPISTGQLEPITGLPLPAYQPSGLAGGLNPQRGGIPHLEASFPLRCFQRLSLPNVANQPCPWRDNWHTRGSSVPVLSY